MKWEKEKDFFTSEKCGISYTISEIDPYNFELWIEDNYSVRTHKFASLKEAKDFANEQ